MTPQEFKAARKQLRHSTYSMANALRMNVRSVQRMEQLWPKNLPVSPRTALHIQLLLSLQQEKPHD